MTIKGNRPVCFLCFLINLFFSNFLLTINCTNTTDFFSPTLESLEFKLKSSLTKASDFSKDFQAFVISMHGNNVEQFLTRNKASLVDNNMTVTWFPSSNGQDQVVLDEFSRLSGFPPLNATRQYSGGGYTTPHHTGCFMSHWNLLRLVKEMWNTLKTTPTALFVFEDDATCAESTITAVTEIVPKLPVDWDMLYIGGKPFSYHTSDPLVPSIRHKKHIQNDFTRKEFRDAACQGSFGRSATGPFAPDGGRNLSLTQLYWQTHYITNTHAYIVNPRRIDRLVHVLEHPTRNYQVPVDIAFAEAAQNGGLKILMSTKELCIQDGTRPKKGKHEAHPIKPRTWQGLYYHRDLQGRRVDDIFFSECPMKL